LVCVLTGAALFSLRFVTPVFGWLLPVVIMKATDSIISFGLLIPLKQRFVIPNPRTFMWLILMGVMDAAGFLSYNFGVIAADNYLPIVVTLSALLGVVTTLLATAFYHERIDTIQTTGVLAVFVGIVILLNS
jgi:drug/metabolite transporter (DMT)-like permease